jgi:hypothetical protein
MREKTAYYVISFPTTSAALGAEQALQQAGISGRLIPTPREITAGCGLAWATSEADQTAALECLAEKKIPTGVGKICLL